MEKRIWHHKWMSIPKTVQNKLLSNVWCTKCSAVTTIIDYEVSYQEPNIILNGKCATCRGEVSRVVETEE